MLKRKALRLFEKDEGLFIIHEDLFRKCQRELWMHQCTDIFTAHHFLQVSYGIHIKYDDWKFVFLAHTSSGQVHHFLTTAQFFIVCDVVKLGSCRILFRVGGIDTVYAGSLQHNICFDFNTTKRRTCI